MVKASAQLKLKAIQAIAAIGLFFISYIVLIAFAIALTGFCSWLGYQIIVNIGNLYIILVGIGLIAFGFMILFFLVKFVFSWKFSHLPRAVRIYEQNNPELFRLLKDITAKTGTDFPKKVFIAHDMNACVYYDSTFLSLFFPVKKNLIIGMALINTTTVLELTSILAHEFGHFSQKTMKVGSFVQYVNKIIYNLLYDNDSYSRFFERISAGSQVFSLFIRLSFWIIRKIQLILKKLFIQINSSDMALSREMEFHADAVAAFIAGPSAFERAIVRLEYTSPIYNQVISFYQDESRPENLYADHLELTRLKAKWDGCDSVGSFPNIPFSLIKKKNPFRLRINTDFDSHPDTEERINRLKALLVQDPVDNLEPAVSLLRNEAKLKKNLSDDVLPPAEKVRIITTKEFLVAQRAELESESLPEVFNGYLHTRVLFEGINPEKVTIDYNDYTTESAGALFSDEMVELARKENTLRMEVSYLTDIDLSTIISVTYNGVRYKPNDISSLRKDLIKEIERMTALLDENDLRITKSLYNLASLHNCLDETKTLIKGFSQFSHHHLIYSQMTIAVTDFIQNTDGLKINTYVQRIEALEPVFKQSIRDLLASGKVEQAETQDIHNLNQYISQDFKYVGVTKYYEANINILMQAVESFARLKFVTFRDTNKELLYLIAGLFCMDESVPNPYVYSSDPYGV